MEQHLSVISWIAITLSRSFPCLSKGVVPDRLSHRHAKLFPQLRQATNAPSTSASLMPQHLQCVSVHGALRLGT